MAEIKYEVTQPDGDGISDVQQIADAIRPQMMARNEYNPDRPIESVKADLLSTGDNKGRGENNGQVGTLDDITSREKMLARNRYNESNNYTVND